jgi:hypothetical protein
MPSATVSTFAFASIAMTPASNQIGHVRPDHYEAEKFAVTGLVD